MGRSRANQHPHVFDLTQDAQREHPTVQCDFFFMEAGKEDAVVALLSVEKTEVAGGNEPVLAAGMRFCQNTRAALGLETILTWNRTYDEKTRTGVAERFVQTLRGLQKTLISHLKSAI